MFLKNPIFNINSELQGFTYKKYALYNFEPDNDFIPKKQRPFVEKKKIETVIPIPPKINTLISPILSIPNDPFQIKSNNQILADQQEKIKQQKREDEEAFESAVISYKQISLSDENDNDITPHFKILNQFEISIPEIPEITSELYSDFSAVIISSFTSISNELRVKIFILIAADFIDKPFSVKKGAKKENRTDDIKDTKNPLIEKIENILKLINWVNAKNDKISSIYQIAKEYPETSNILVINVLKSLKGIPRNEKSHSIEKFSDFEERLNSVIPLINGSTRSLFLELLLFPSKDSKGEIKENVGDFFLSPEKYKVIKNKNYLSGIVMKISRDVNHLDDINDKVASDVIALFKDVFKHWNTQSINDITSFIDKIISLISDNQLSITKNIYDKITNVSFIKIYEKPEVVKTVVNKASKIRDNDDQDLDFDYVKVSPASMRR